MIIRDNKKSPFITLEGTDGSGISTQAELLERALREEGWEVYLTKEPTDGPAGVMIRLELAGRLIHMQDAVITSLTQAQRLALLFAADRIDHIYDKVLPRLNMGVVVISDRYYLSSLAFQGIDMDNFEWIYEINSKCIRPDLTIFLDVDAILCVKRMQRRRWHVELFEEVKKLEQVRANYLKAIDFLSRKQEKIVVVNGGQPIKEVHNEIMRSVKKALVQNKSTTTTRPVGNQLPLE